MRNEVTFGGRVTRDLEKRQAGKGSVVNFSLAQNKEYVVKKGDESETREETIYINCVAWNKLVDELMAENVGKGTPIEVTGVLNQRRWEDKDGKRRDVTEIIVREFSILNTQPKKVEKSNKKNIAPPKDEEFAAVEVGVGDSVPF